MQHFAICSNPECDYSTPFSGGAAIQFVLDHPMESPQSMKHIDSLLPKDRYCELCGAALLFFCPRCKKGLFTSPMAKFCRHCGKEIKPIPRKDRRARGDRRKFSDSDYKGPERRSGRDRRFGKGSRKPG
jgi:hypothetical protein